MLYCKAFLKLKKKIHTNQFGGSFVKIGRRTSQIIYISTKLTFGCNFILKTYQKLNENVFVVNNDQNQYLKVLLAHLS